MNRSSPRLRHALIGVGANVFSMHRPALDLETVEVAGACDINEKVGEERAAQLGCPFYSDYRRMLSEIRPDVVVVMTPHPLHAPMTIDALQAGCHVLVEKPMAVHVAEADAMIAAQRSAGRLLAVNFQQRLRPEVMAARRVITDGHLGKVQHVDMKVLWPRAAVYYRLSSWRGTWEGEGGGLLLNQAPHNLDMLCHLVGMPSRVYAWTPTIFHNIRTEDTVQACLEWPDGALGSLHASTAEAGLPERMEIVGTMGSLVIARGALLLHRLDVDIRDFLRTSPEPFSAPDVQTNSIEVGDGRGDHAAIYRNFHDAIMHGTPPAADGDQGRMSLELANGMIYSSYTGSEVRFPLDRRKYADLLADLRRKN